MKTQLTAALALASAASAALAAPVTSPFVEAFDDADTPLDLSFEDFQTQASGTGVNGTDPGFTVSGGELVFYDNTDFGDVGAASVQPTGLDGAAAFSVSTEVDVDSIDFTTTRTGVYAYAVNPTVFTQDFSGLYAYVQELDTTGGSYQFVLANGSTELATAGPFDLTDGSPDFDVSLAGNFLPDGGAALTATLTDAGGQNSRVLTATLGAGDLPTGDNFGIRANPGFNTFEATYDNFAVNITPIPEPASAAAVGLLGLTALRRRH